MVGRRRLGILDKRGHRAVLRASDPNAFLDPWQLVRAGIRPRLGVGDEDRVVLRDENAARAPELPPFVEERAVLVEDLDAVVLAVADEQAPARVHGDGVRFAELAAPRSFAAPLADERAVL